MNMNIFLQIFFRIVMFKFTGYISKISYYKAGNEIFTAKSYEKIVKQESMITKYTP